MSGRSFDEALTAAIKVRQNGDPWGAIRVLRAAPGDSPERQVFEAASLTMLGLFAPARDIYERCIRQAEHDGDRASLVYALNGLSKTQRLSGDLDGALMSTKKAIRFAPNNLETHRAHRAVLIAMAKGGATELYDVADRITGTSDG